jgi:hypothetical protein
MWCARTRHHYRLRIQLAENGSAFFCGYRPATLETSSTPQALERVRGTPGSEVFQAAIPGAHPIDRRSRHHRKLLATCRGGAVEVALGLNIRHGSCLSTNFTSCMLFLMLHAAQQHLTYMMLPQLLPPAGIAQPCGACIIMV